MQYCQSVTHTFRLSMPSNAVRCRMIVRQRVCVYVFFDWRYGLVRCHRISVSSNCADC